MFEGPSSEEDNPLNWDPVVEALNKHVALSQVDSGRVVRDRLSRVTYSHCLVSTRSQVKVPWIISGIPIVVLNSTRNLWPGPGNFTSAAGERFSSFVFACVTMHFRREQGQSGNLGKGQKKSEEKN